MFERQLESLHIEINRNESLFEYLKQNNSPLNKFISASDLIEGFISSKDIPWQSEIINSLIYKSNHPPLQQYCYLILTALFWRNLTYLATSCSGRQFSPDDLLSQSQLQLLQLISKASKREKQEKIYSNISRSLRRDFYIWVKANDFEFSEILESHTEPEIQTIDTDKIISRIISEKILKKKEVDLWLEVERDKKSLKEIAKEKGIKYDAFQKRIRRIIKKIEKHQK